MPDGIDRPALNKQLRVLNLFFGIIIMVLSIYVISSFLINNANIQIIMISITLLIMGVAFTSIGIPDKGQDETAQKIEISIGFFITVVGLISVFISLINSNVVIKILLLAFNVLSIIIAGGAMFAVSSENWTVKKSRWVMIGIGIIMIIFCAVNITIFAFGILLDKDFNLIIIILLSIALSIHGLSRILVYFTEIYK